MFKSGDTVQINPAENPHHIKCIFAENLEMGKIYVVDEVETEMVPHDEETGMPEYEHAVVRLQGDSPDRWYDASWFVPA